MKMVQRWFAGSLFLGLALIVGLLAGNLSADDGQGNGWLAFREGAVQTPPTLTLTAADAGEIRLEATVPGVLSEKVEVDGQIFSRLYGDGFGHPAEVGLPDLPVLRRDVEIPFGAAVEMELVSAEYSEMTLDELGLSPIYPLQPPVPKTEDERPPLVIDTGFYAQDAFYPADPLALGEEYIVRGHRVQPVEVWPVMYNPSAGTLRIYHRVVFRLKLRGSDMETTQALAERYASPAFERRLAGQLLNYNQGQPAVEFAPNALVGYLIITSDAYYDAMVPLADLRSSRGFDVTMVRQSEIPNGGTNTGIKAYIQNAYDTWMIPPSYVLLVGDTNTMPGWNGVEIATITDLYYVTMDGENDWHPDIGRGRFPVRSADQATIMVDKYLAYANLTGQEPWLKTAAFIATCDQYLVAEGTHNYVIDNYTGPGGYTGTFPNDPQVGGDQLYCITHNATAADIQTSLNQGRWVAIYSGHGSWTGWEMDYGQDDVQNLTNYGMFPFVASHACITGDFEQYEVYGETWVLQENTGALVFWGSSDSSYWDEDDILERAMFDSLFAEGDDHPAVTEMTYYGLAQTEAAYPYRARYYWETYNILGDPAVKAFLEPDLPTFTLSVEPDSFEVCESGTVTSSVEIGSVMNYSETVSLSTGPLPTGITADFDPVSAQAPYTSELSLVVAPGTAAGDYPIVITATDEISWTLDAWVELRLADQSPEAPVLVEPADGAVDVPRVNVSFEWDPVPQATSYELQIDDDPGFGSPEVVVTGIETNGYTLAGPLEISTTYYWRVRASNGCGVGPFSAAFHFTVESLPCILVVDDDNNSPDVAPYFTEALDSLDYTYDLYDVGGGTGDGPSAGELAGYEAVIWFSGDKFGDSAGPGSTDEEGLAAYLDGGGRLFLSSQDYLYDFGLTDFGADYLGIGSFTNDSGGAATKYGVSGDPIGDGLGPYPLSYPLSFSDYGDVVNPAGGASVAFRAQAAGGNNLDLDKDGGAWRTVFFGTSWVPIYNASAANGEEVLGRILDWFGGCSCDAVHDPDFDWDPVEPVAGVDTVTFSGSAVGDAPIDYAWSFGDGNTAVGQVVTHTYQADGAFTVVMTATNCITAEASISHEVTVLPCVAPEIVELVSDSPVTIGEMMTFTATVTGTSPITYTWQFGDGQVAIGPGLAVMTHTYEMAGSYTVTLEVASPCGFDGISQEVVVDAAWEHIFLPVIQK